MIFFTVVSEAIVYLCAVFKISENISDALRNTIAVLLPLMLLYSFDQQVALGVSVGALLMSLTDLPGNRRAKTRSAVQCVSIFFLVTLVFSISLADPLYTGLALVSITFLLSMIAAFGGRSLVAGMMGVALMVFLLGLRPHEPWAFSAYIMLGGIWFYLVVVIQVYLWPFRSLRQALQEALYATGQFLEAKAACYDLNVPLDEGYRRTIALHLRVSDKQELVRQLLLSDRAAMRRAGKQVNDLSQKALALISFYEQVTATHYDYEMVRERLSTSAALSISRELIGLLAAEAKGNITSTEKFNELLGALNHCAKELSKTDAAVIKGIATNVKAIKLTLDDILTDAPQQSRAIPEDTSAFLPDKGNYLQKLKSQFHFSSPVLRFALRLTILMALGYTSAWLLADDNYSYWLLLTIVIVARPRLAVTWQRNRQRLLGTLAGVIVSGLLIWLVQAAVPLLAISALALFGFFVWNRPRYGWSVLCVTVCVLVSLSVYRGEPLLLLSARVWYSLLGCGLAIGGIFLFPLWSHTELKILVRQAVSANRSFLAAVTDRLALQDVWLARKNAHIHLARLSEAINHARVEPGKGDLSAFEHLQTLNYRINAVIISVFLAGRVANTESLGKSISHLDDFLNDKIAIDRPAKSSTLLKGTQLLEKLSHELSWSTR